MRKFGIKFKKPILKSEIAFATMYYLFELLYQLKVITKKVNI